MPSPSHRDNKYGFKETAPLKKLEGADEAKALLKRLKKHLELLMTARGMAFSSLNEFYPTQKGKEKVLGEFTAASGGKGPSVQIRLRTVADRDKFHEWDELVDMVLHEVCHVYGNNHSPSFRRNLDRLKFELQNYYSCGVDCEKCKWFEGGKFKGHGKKVALLRWITGSTI